MLNTTSNELVCEVATLLATHWACKGGLKLAGLNQNFVNAVHVLAEYRAGTSQHQNALDILCLIKTELT